MKTKQYNSNLSQKSSYHISSAHEQLFISPVYSSIKTKQQRVYTYNQLSLRLVTTTKTTTTKKNNNNKTVIN